MGRPARGLVLVLALVLGLAGLATAAEDIVLGMSAAFSGSSRGLGIELYRGAAAWFAAVNEKGGIRGRRIALRTYDDGYDPVPAIENTVRLVEKDRALLLFNYVGTPTVTRVLPLLKRYEDRPMLLFFPFTGAEPQRRPPYGDFVLNLRTSYREETAALVDELVGLGRKRIAVFYQADAYGRSGWEGVRRQLASHGLAIVAEATYRRGTPFAEAFRRQVEIVRAGNPDAVIAVGSYAPCAGFIRDARDAGLEVPIANISFVGSESLLELLAAAGERAKADYTRRLINTQVVPSYDDERIEAVREYRELMNRYAPPPPAGVGPDYRPIERSYVGFEGFLNAKLLDQVLRRISGPIVPERLADLFRGDESYDIGIGHALGFGPERHQALGHVYFTFAEGGRFVPLQDWSRFAP